MNDKSFKNPMSCLQQCIRRSGGGADNGDDSYVVIPEGVDAIGGGVF